MSTVSTPPEQSVVLHDVSWQTYAHLLEDLADNSTPRLTYDRGTLEIMSPTAQREELNRTLALLVEILALELGLDIRSLGSTTFRQEDLEPFFYAATYYLGAAILGRPFKKEYLEDFSLSSVWELGPDVFLSLWVGGVLVGAILAFIGYFVVIGIDPARSNDIRRPRFRVDH